VGLFAVSVKDTLDLIEALEAWSEGQMPQAA
jgi:hypothetical protein